MRRTHLVGIAAVAGLGMCVGLVWLIPRSVVLSMYCETIWPGAIPSRWWARNLDSRDNNIVLDSLAFLTHRADPVAVDRALPLLRSSDDYVWLNAAEYLGACHRREAIPYLIKALRHTAWRTDNETVRYLQAMTGQAFGPEFDKWRNWWAAEHPGQPFDWTSYLGFRPRLAEPSQ